MFDPDCGIDEREARERARRRGRTYQCMTCHYREGRRVVDIKCRIEEHILKMLGALENVPYYCLKDKEKSSFYNISRPARDTGIWLRNVVLSKV